MLILFAPLINESRLRLEELVIIFIPSTCLVWYFEITHLQEANNVFKAKLAVL